MSKYWNLKTQGIEPYVAGEQPKDGQKVIKLNTNENPYSPSPRIKEVLKNFDIDTLRLYPDTNSTVFIDAVASVYGVKRENVFAGNGSDEVLAICWQALFEKKTNTALKVLMPEISYSFYPVYSEFYDVAPEKIPLRENFRLDPNDYCGKECAGIAIANPNAPTSRAITLDEIEVILKANPDVPVIIDEAYAAYAEGYGSAVSLVNKYKNLIVVMTMSKSYGLAGSRLGYAIASEEIIEGMKKVRDSFNSYPVDRLTQQIGAAAMLDREYFEKNRVALIKTRAFVTEELRKIGFEIPDSSANFIFAKPPKGADAETLYKNLKAKGILVRYFSKPVINEYLRITIGTDEEMKVFLDEVRKEI